MTDTATQEVPAVTRQLSPEQKKAATLRRDATLLRKYDPNSAKAAELEAKADVLFPQTRQSKRVDPLTVLSSDEQKALKDYFHTAKGFERLAQVMSAKKLQDILMEISA